MVVYQRTIWGAGKAPDAAGDDALRKPNCPSVSDLAFVPIFGMPLGEKKEPAMSDRSTNPQDLHPIPSLPVPFEQLEFPDDCPDEEDFNWAWDDLELQRLYGGLVVAVRQRTVWGAGKNHRAAWEDAQRKPNCPPSSEFAFVPISGLPLAEMPDRKKQS